MVALSCPSRVQDSGDTVMINLIVIMLLVLTQAGDISIVSKNNDNNIYDAIPVDEREDFSISLNKAIKLMEKDDWNSLYEWFDIESPMNEKKITSREKFVEYIKKYRLLKYLVTDVYYVPPIDSWAIKGCAMFPKPPQFAEDYKGGIVSCFYARHTESGWRFMFPPGIQVDKLGKIQSCIVGKDNVRKPGN